MFLLDCSDSAFAEQLSTNVVESAMTRIWRTLSVDCDIHADGTDRLNRSLRPCIDLLHWSSGSMTLMIDGIWLAYMAWEIG